MNRSPPCPGAVWDGTGWRIPVAPLSQVELARWHRDEAERRVLAEAELLSRQRREVKIAAARDVLNEVIGAKVRA